MTSGPLFPGWSLKPSFGTYKREGNAERADQPIGPNTKRAAKHGRVKRQERGMGPGTASNPIVSALKETYATITGARVVSDGPMGQRLLDRLSDVPMATTARGSLASGHQRLDGHDIFTKRAERERETQTRVSGSPGSAPKRRAGSEPEASLPPLWSSKDEGAHEPYRPGATLNRKGKNAS